MPRTAPCLLTLDPRALASAEDILGHARELGFGGILWQPDAPLLGDGDPLPTPLASWSGHKLIEIDLGRVPIDHPLVSAHPEAFAIRRSGASTKPIDPRRPMPAQGEARARLKDERALAVLAAPMIERLSAAIDAGATGFRLIDADTIAPLFLAHLAETLRARHPDLLLIGDAPAEGPFDALATRWAGLPAAVANYQALRQRAPILAQLTPGSLAHAALADGLIVPGELLQSHPDLVAAARALVREARGHGGEMRLLSGAGAKVVGILRTDKSDVRSAGSALVVLVNRSAEAQPEPDPARLLANAGADFVTPGSTGEDLAANEVRLFATDRAQPIAAPIPQDKATALAAASAPRLVIEDITPSVAGGDFAVKRIVGEAVDVRATIYADGHEQLAAELLYGAEDDERWTAVRMAQLPNDGWSAAFPLPRLGRHQFVVEAWLDRFGGFRRDFARKLEAGVALPVDSAEGLALIEQAAARSDGDLRATLAD
ncbi:MAG: alpha amylase catalytic region, partial [Sphingomonas bacterium]|nr:alpha amylase catalytic region [Sphingomonas bacterium]